MWKLKDPELLRIRFIHGHGRLPRSEISLFWRRRMKEQTEPYGRFLDRLYEPHASL